MRDIVSGAISGKTDAHIIYIQYVIGFILKIFYDFFPIFNWYGIFILGVHILCLIVFIYFSCKGKKNSDKYFFSILYSIIFLLVDIYSIIQLSFTTTAGICVATAIYVFATMDVSEDKKNILYRMAIIIFLFILGYCIRYKIFLMALPFAFIILLYKFFLNKNLMKFYILGLTILFISLGAIFTIEKIAYSNDIWQNYLIFNKARSQILDYNGYINYDENIEFFNSIGVSKEAYNTLLNSNLNMAEEISADKYIQISDYIDKKMDINVSFVDKAKNAFTTTLTKDFNIFSNYQSMSIFIGFTLLLISALIKNDKKMYCVIFSSIFVNIVVCCYLNFIGRFPERISTSIFFFNSFILLGLLLEYSRLLKNLNLKKMFLFISPFILVFSSCIINVINTNLNYDIYSSTLLPFIDYCGNNLENVYYLDIRDIAERRDILTIRNKSRYINYIYLSGWKVNSAPYLENLESKGVKNITDNIINNANSFYIAKEGRDIEYICEYYNSKNINITYEISDSFFAGTERFLVYKFTSI